MRTLSNIFESDVEHSIVQSPAHEELEREVYVFQLELFEVGVYVNAYSIRVFGPRTFDVAAFCSIQ